MDDHPSLVANLVEEALASGRTPEAVCIDRPDLLASVRRMLERCLRNHAELDALFSPAPTRPPSEGPGTVIGPYTLLERLGEGGFGTVYAAEQAWPVRRRVALKVIKPGMDTREVVARFEAEKQALALMDHPNIARVFDAGATGSGRPFFAMEMVEGTPITAYCNTRRLTVRERLVLMVSVCRAVQSAHQKGVIHRDLKPSNVLVAEHDGAPVPKVIDFGIAKATAAAPSDRTQFTASGGFIGTPAYMSPEQADPSGVGVDTRTDVYGLGALLYELLAGTPPIDPRARKAAGPGEVARLIREAEPLKPSASLSAAAGGTLDRVAAGRSSDPRRLVQRVRGELDWVVMRALEKDRNRRYDTAAALADDLARHLNGEPVAAGPPGRAYRLRKFAHRHRAAVGVCTLGAVALLLVIAGTTLGLVREAGLRHLAEVRKAEVDAERRSARAVVMLLTDILAKASPDATKDRAVRDTLFKAMIEPALRGVDERFRDQPMARAAVQEALAKTLIRLGRFDLALPQAEGAWRQRRATLGDDHPDTFAALAAVAQSLRYLHRHAEAEPLARRAWERSRRVLGEDDPEAIRALTAYVATLGALGRHAEAEPLAIQAWERGRRVLGGDHPDTLQAGYNRALNLSSLDRQAEASPLMKQVWDRRRRVLGDDSREALRAMDGYAATLAPLGRPAEAEPLLRESWGRSLLVLGDDHPDTVMGLHNLASFLHRQGRPAEAEPLFRRAVDVDRRVKGDDHPDTIGTVERHASALIELGRPAEAEAPLRDAWERSRRLRGGDYPGTLVVLRTYAAAVAVQGRWATAEPLCRQVWESMRRLQGDHHPETIQALGFYAASMARQGRRAEAAALLADLVAADRRAGMAGTIPFADLLFAQADLLRRIGDRSGAVPPLREATDLLRTAAPADPNRGRDLFWLGTCLMATGHAADAESAFRENYAFDLKYPGPDRPAVPGSLEGLIASLKAQGRPADEKAIRAEFGPAAAPAPPSTGPATARR